MDNIQNYIVKAQDEIFMRVTNHASTGVYFNTGAAINSIPYYLDWSNDSEIFIPKTLIISCETLISSNGLTPFVTIQIGIESFDIPSGSTMILPVIAQSAFIICRNGGDPLTNQANRYTIILSDKKYEYAYFTGTVFRASSFLAMYPYSGISTAPLTIRPQYRLAFYAAQNNNFGIQAGYNLLDLNNNQLSLKVYNDYVEFTINNPWLPGIADSSILDRIWRRISIPCVGWSSGNYSNRTANGLTLKQFYLLPRISWVKNPSRIENGKLLADSGAATSLLLIQGFFPYGCFPAKPTDAIGSPAAFNMANNIIADGILLNVLVNEINF